MSILDTLRGRNKKSGDGQPKTDSPQTAENIEPANKLLERQDVEKALWEGYGISTEMLGDFSELRGRALSTQEFGAVYENLLNDLKKYKLTDVSLSYSEMFCIMKDQVRHFKKREKERREREQQTGIKEEPEIISHLDVAIWRYVHRRFRAAYNLSDDVEYTEAQRVEVGKWARKFFNQRVAPYLKEQAQQSKQNQPAGMFHVAATFEDLVEAQAQALIKSVNKERLEAGAKPIPPEEEERLRARALKECQEHEKKMRALKNQGHT